MADDRRPVSGAELRRLHPLPAERGRETHDHALPELHSVGSTRYTKAQVLGLVAHIHPGAWEFHYVGQGVVEWWVGDQVCDVPPGHVHITAPDLVHGGVGTVMQPCQLRWCQVAIPADGRLPGLDETGARFIAAGLAGITTSHFPAPAQVGGLIQAMVDELRGGAPGATTVVRSLLHQFLVAVLRARSGGQAAGDASSAMRRVIAWVEQHLAERLTVEGLAVVAGMSPRQLHRRFLDDTGFAPLDFIVHRRIHHARRLLRDPAASITSIALDLGFPSSQYFATAFKRHTGITPGAYRERQG